MITLSATITAVITTLFYLILVYVLVGVVKSISFSDYLLKILKKPFKFFFEATMFVDGICLIIVGATIAEEVVIMQIIGGAFIFMVGVFSDFQRNKYFKFAHMFFAIGGFVIYSLSFWIELHEWYLSAMIAALAIIGLITFKQKIYGVEAPLIAGIIISIFITIYK